MQLLLHKFKIHLLFTFLLLTSLLNPYLMTKTVYASDTNNFSVNAKSAIAIDGNTGQLLYKQNTKQKLPIASISKLLTILVIEQEIKQSKLSNNTQVTINKDIAQLAKNPNYSNAGLQLGQNYTINQLIQMALISSADDATLALVDATHLSTAEFNQKMINLGHKIGLSDISIYNSVGLQNQDLLKSYQLKNVSNEAENAMTTNDIAKLTKYFINYNHGQLLDITKNANQNINTLNSQIPGLQLKNLNKLSLVNKNKDITVEGLKTGTSDAAGKCFVGVSKYKSHQIITVILGAKNDDARFTETSKLLNHIINSYDPINLDQQTFKSLKIKVTNGEQKKVKLHIVGNIPVWMTKKININSIFNTKISDSLVAPVQKNNTVGYITISSKIKFIDNNANDFKLKLKTDNAVHQLTFLDKVKITMQNFIDNFVIA